MKNSVNVKTVKKCAFCKYWYDPSNAYISPKGNLRNVWEYENSARCKCIKKNKQIAAFNSCKDYECKVPIT